MLSQGALTSPSNAYYDAIAFYGIMLYPEDEEKQVDHLDTTSMYAAKNLTGEDTDITKAFWVEHGRKAGNLLKEQSYYELYAHKLVYARKRVMLGAPARRGALSGEILSRLLKPSVGSLRRAYPEMASGQTHTLEDGTQLKAPSSSTLQKIWEEYRTVAPFWAAVHACKESFEKLLVNGPLTSTPIHLESATYFKKFLQVAEFFRQKLLEATVPSTKAHIIPRSLRPMVWQVVDEEKNAIIPTEISIR